MAEAGHSEALGRLAADTIRMLAVDGVQKANSGHPGMPMGMADCAFVLWGRYLTFNPEDPDWPNRDRFILSAGHGSMLLYALLHLAGYPVSIEDLKQFRQWESRTPGHPELGTLPGVETTTGPLGQGFANGVGMALAGKMMGARFNRADFSPVDHFVYGIVSDGDLMEGVASEAASIAGHLGLGNLIYIYDDNQITIEGNTRLTFSEDVQKRFEAYGWHTLTVDGHDHGHIAEAIEKSRGVEDRPSLILARTHIAYGSPNKQDDASSHGSPLGEDEVRATKEKLGWPLAPPFHVPEEVQEYFQKQVASLKSSYAEWHAGFEAWKRSHPDLARLWETMHDGDAPDDLEAMLKETIPEKDVATRVSGGKILQKAAQMFPSLVGGSADLAPSTKTIINDSPPVEPGRFEGRNFHFGIREHGMGGILNGLSLYGGLIPYGSTFLVFSDYMRPSIRLAALMELQVIYVFTHDSLFVGEDGPTHQPVEHLAALRAIPNVTVFRPADSLETAMAWAYALRRRQGPTVLCLTRQGVSNLKRKTDFDCKEIQKGGYVVSRESGKKPELLIVATGSEVSIALDAKALLEQSGRSVRLVSMPSLDVFKVQPEAYRASVLSDADIPTVVVEAGVDQGWHALRRLPLLFIGMNRFGASAPYPVLAEKFGFTGSSIAKQTTEWLKTI